MPNAPSLADWPQPLERGGNAVALLASGLSRQAERHPKASISLPTRKVLISAPGSLCLPKRGSLSAADLMASWQVLDLLQLA